MASGRAPIDSIESSLQLIERCLLLAETTAGLLQNDVRSAHGSLAAQLGKEARAALAALAVARRNLDLVGGRRGR